TRRSSRAPASRSSSASCTDTDEGLYDSASATAATVPRRANSCSRRSRRSSIVRIVAWIHVGNHRWNRRVCWLSLRGMVLVPLLAAPTLMVAATAAERRFGAAVAGVVAALPVALSIIVLAVGTE